MQQFFPNALLWASHGPSLGMNMIQIDLDMILFSKGGDLPKGSSKESVVSDPLCDKKRAVFGKE
jgi:hypothetical protein